MRVLRVVFNRSQRSFQQFAAKKGNHPIRLERPRWQTS